MPAWAGQCQRTIHRINSTQSAASKFRCGKGMQLLCRALQIACDPAGLQGRFRNLDVDVRLQGADDLEHATAAFFPHLAIDQHRLKRDTAEGERVRCRHWGAVAFAGEPGRLQCLANLLQCGGASVNDEYVHGNAALLEALYASGVPNFATG
ncbi:hypothetical protein DGI_1070 [Megalodesulfovibrio gigas DSM 1382 = ATCC 19364]|uniref:Uncharacterized protein n=1 Tax=Megalodesulfovibrio gigas (strain ATCC 19364 / DSM 1382 / NCIMB 9332 / VKM B-1759) TaxID=1121448 RepID=T2G9T7_MEGG1|nr:hypothetical protein DGI_1070 [Megalodesulfovibrio gigas DSM 1382 = ATCC 19364]